MVSFEAFVALVGGLLFYFFGSWVERTSSPSDRDQLEKIERGGPEAYGKMVEATWRGFRYFRHVGIFFFVWAAVEQLVAWF
ncbi:MAG: hypothetical protein R2733_02600 [Acidimicrobiales bacterium]